MTFAQAQGANASVPCPLSNGIPTVYHTLQPPILSAPAKSVITIVNSPMASNPSQSYGLSFLPSPYALKYADIPNKSLHALAPKPSAETPRVSMAQAPTTTGASELTLAAKDTAAAAGGPSSTGGGSFSLRQPTSGSTVIEKPLPSLRPLLPATPSNSIPSPSAAILKLTTEMPLVARKGAKSASASSVAPAANQTLQAAKPSNASHSQSPGNFPNSSAASATIDLQRASQITGISQANPEIPPEAGNPSQESIAHLNAHLNAHSQGVESASAAITATTPINFPAATPASSIPYRLPAGTKTSRQNSNTPKTDSLDRIHFLQDIDFVNISGLLALRLDYVKWTLTDPNCISRLTVAQIKKCVRYFSTKFGIEYRPPYLKYQWVGLIEEILHESRTTGARPAESSPFNVRFNSAMPSTPSTPTPGAQKIVMTPSTPLPRGFATSGTPTVGTPEPRATPVKNAPISYQTSNTPRKTVQFPVPLLCEPKPLLAKLYSRMKLIPCEFGSFYDFKGLLDVKDLEHMNATILSFRQTASTLASNPNLRCILMYLRSPKLGFSSFDYDITVGGYPFFDLTPGMMVDSLEKSPVPTIFDVKIRPKRKSMNSDSIVAIFLMDQLDENQRLSKIYEANISKNLKVLRPNETDMPDGLSRTPAIPRDLNALRNLALASILTEGKVMEKKPPSGDVEIGDSIISFTCPLTLARIEHPAKGTACKHAQCFDLKSFLAMIGLKSQWKCSVCGMMLRPTQIILDFPFLRLLHAYPNDTKCIIKADGSDAPFSGDVDEEVDITEDPQPVHDVDEAEMGGNSSPSDATNSKRKVVDVIDVDSFDDEIFLVGKKMRSPPNSDKKMAVSTDCVLID
ncbi:hypothetical protein HDU67_008647 [Dinochytrium kinnereticum]|nr:hypothetical protein HDU67_008647 [Dinochytrium kinnereticum]